MIRILIVVASLGVWVLLAGYLPALGRYIPDAWAGSVGGIVILVPILLIGWLFRGFLSWHRAFHRIMLDGLISRRSS